MFAQTVSEQIAQILPGVIGVLFEVEEGEENLYDLEVTLLFERVIPLQSRTRECKAIAALCRDNWVAAARPQAGVLPPGSRLRAVSLLFTVADDEQ